MENSYTANKDFQQDKRMQEDQQHKPTGHYRQTEEPAVAFAHTAQLLQSGAKLQDLSPEEMREVAATIGNQSVLQLLHGGNPVPLAFPPPGRSTEEALPETAVDIRWPSLCALPRSERNGPLFGKAFSMEWLRPMGQCTGSGVIPDG